MPDLHPANSVSKPFDPASTIQFWTERVDWVTTEVDRSRAHYECGLAYAAMRQYELAIEQFDEAIIVDPENIGAYANRAMTKRRLGDHAGALKDYDSALEKCAGTEGPDKQIGGIYWNRGQMHMALGNGAQGIADYRRAIELGYRMYFNDASNDGPRVQAHPGYADEYRPLTVEDDEPTN